MAIEVKELTIKVNVVDDDRKPQFILPNDLDPTYRKLKRQIIEECLEEMTSKISNPFDR